VAEIVKPEMRQSSGASGSDEPFRDEIRQPGPGPTSVLAEHEPLPHRPHVGGHGAVLHDNPMGSEHGQGVGVERDAIGAPSLGRPQFRAVGSFDEGPGERDRSTGEVDVGPAQRQQLAPASAGANSEAEVRE
jgi:hypothetical protein